MDKKALRKAISEKKRALTATQIEERSRILADRLFATEAYRQARSLYAYLSFNQEVRTEPIIRRAWVDGKRVAVPRIIGQDMTFIWLESLDRLKEGYYGILEPVEDGPVADDPDALMLMPGLAFDREGHRVGYGGGFYDRFLAREPGHPRLALCFDFQLVDSLQAEEHDVPVDLVIADG